MTDEEIGPVHWPTGVPQHLKCARAACPSPRTATGEHRFCGPECRHLSEMVHDSVPTTPTGWSWAP